MSLHLDLSRGKPSKEQLDLSVKMLDVLHSHSVLDSEDGTDCRNYGGADGIPEAKKLMADLMDVSPAHVMVFDNSSLNLMFQVIAHGMMDGLSGCEPMLLQKKRKFLCPAPGYDRHFAITERFGFELITIPMKEDGPDMDMVRKYVEKDASVKGIWCVPKYQNPTGVVFSDEVVKAFAELNPKAADFRIFWDNAYCVHSLYPEELCEIPDILKLCEEAGHPDMVYEFCSTSKISFAGDGISAVASSAANLADLRNYFKFETIGPDKINQLRHVRYFKNRQGVLAHMKKHADILRPKFEMVEKVLEEELGGLGLAEWTLPRGGYFISLNTLPGCAKEVVRLSKEAGVTFTAAGATFPYGHDPEDRNIRLAPSFATLEEIEQATRVLAACIREASASKADYRRRKAV
ncbi:MAG: aminotransferase class I/II-fold pyridoxal phosphate-dependent enzyme [Clostridiales bacterium]|nr:aminotransferase class I/II-fold pyridoxal phosphate-dependent enzyme [Clostridiales bacterium]